jgi:hypothetical protein
MQFVNENFATLRDFGEARALLARANSHQKFHRHQGSFSSEAGEAAIPVR